MSEVHCGVFAEKNQLTKLTSIFKQKHSDVRMYGCVSLRCHPSFTSLIFPQIIVLMAPFHHSLFASLLLQIKPFAEDELSSKRAAPLYQISLSS